MSVANSRSPSLQVDWDSETSLVDAPLPPEALPPAVNRTRRIEKVDPWLLARTRDRSMAPAAPPAVSPLAHRPFAMLRTLPRVRPALPTQVLASGPVSVRPPPSSTDGATLPAPPPAMTGAIVLHEGFFEDDVAPEDVFAPTGTIDVDESWLEDEDLLDEEIAPASFWKRGHPKSR